MLRGRFLWFSEFQALIECRFSVKVQSFFFSPRLLGFSDVSTLRFILEPAFLHYSQQEIHNKVSFFLEP